jgi:hypothetical protein
MVRIPAIEKALPDDVRRTVRNHPAIALAVAALGGYYLGKSYGREILSALVAVAISAGSARARRLLGVEPPRDSRRR